MKTYSILIAQVNQSHSNDQPQKTCSKDTNSNSQEVQEEKRGETIITPTEQAEANLQTSQSAAQIEPPPVPIRPKKRRFKKRERTFGENKKNAMATDEDYLKGLYENPESPAAVQFSVQQLHRLVKKEESGRFLKIKLENGWTNKKCTQATGVLCESLKAGVSLYRLKTSHMF